MSVAQFGSVAQLYRVSDSGSEGSGFEPQQGHKSVSSYIPRKGHNV